jgi:hypothetical protein
VSRTFNVKLDLPPTEGLRTGQFGRVSVPVAEVKLLLVPQSAILKRGQMELVFVAKEGKAALRLVKTGKVLEDRVEVLSGLEECIDLSLAIRDKFNDGFNMLRDLGLKLKLANREQKTNAREIHSVRSTLRSLQGLKI